jgi:DNA-binding transcriptional LysR family regulator
MSIQKSLVLGGHGFTILPPISVARELASGQLTGAPVGDPQLTRTIVLATPANRAASRHVRHVVEILVGCVKDAVLGHQWPQAQWIGG